MNKKTIIITGASSGLGKEYLKQLLSDHSIEECWILARRKELLLELSRQDERIIPVSIDLTNKKQLYAFINMLDQEKPNIQLLINNAGMGKVGSVEESSINDTANMIDLNCKALVIMTQICLPFMHAGSRIIEIASVAGFQPMPNFAVYAASKAFVLSYTKALHKELKYRKIKVTAVCPYWVKDTQFISIAENHADYQNMTLATTSETVVRNSLKDSIRNKTISTPDIVSRFDHIVSSILPDSIMVSLMDQIRKM